MVSLRAYADGLLVVGPDGRQVRLARSFERDQTLYDWMHYIALIERKPGALRNGAPSRPCPSHCRKCSASCCAQRWRQGDGAGAHGVSLHGLEAVVVAVELALQSGRVSAEHVLNVLASEGAARARATGGHDAQAQHAATGQPAALRRTAQRPAS